MLYLQRQLKNGFGGILKHCKNLLKAINEIKQYVKIMIVKSQ